MHPNAMIQNDTQTHLLIISYHIICETFVFESIPSVLSEICIDLCVGDG